RATASRAAGLPTRATAARSSRADAGAAASAAARARAAPGASQWATAGARPAAATSAAGTATAAGAHAAVTLAGAGAGTGVPRRIALLRGPLHARVAHDLRSEPLRDLVRVHARNVKESGRHALARDDPVNHPRDRIDHRSPGIHVLRRAGREVVVRRE